MGTADRIERERLAKRTAILDAARELFVERGVEAVTLREVAQKIEYSTTAIYVHFKDKHELITQMCAEDFAKFGAALLTTAKIADPVERLDQLGKAYVEFALAMPRHYTVMFLTPAATHEEPPPEADDPGFRGFQLLLHTVEECIAQGRFRPEHTDANGIALGIWSVVHGLVSLLIVKGSHPRFRWKEPEEFLRIATDPMMRGLLAEPDEWFSLRSRSAKPARSSAPASAPAPRAAPGGRAGGSRSPRRRSS